MRVSDKEQIEMLKDWWNDYGKAIAIAIAIGLIVGLGWRYWNQAKNEKLIQASTLYQSMVAALEKKDFDTVQRTSDELINQYPNTPYATMGSLFAARLAVGGDNLDLAINKLQWAIDHSKSASFKQIARLRSARVLLEQDKPQAALNMLATVDDNTFQPLIDHIKGDAYVALEKPAEAKSAYLSAQKAFQAIGVDDPLLNMKIAQ